MSKHTPGDWYVSHNELTSDSLPGRNTIATMAAWLPHAEEEQRANARLIAAAPCLLEALRMMTSHYCNLVRSGDAGNWEPDAEPEVMQARAAIAKAEGQ